MRFYVRQEITQSVVSPESELIKLDKPNISISLIRLVA